MKTKITISALFAMLFLAGSITATFAYEQKENGDDEGHPNFTWIDDFEEGVALWWNPEGAGQSTGLVLEDEEGNPSTYRAHETEIVNPATGSTGSMKLAVVWDTDVEWFEPTTAGSQSHFIRLYMPPGGANVPERRFLPGQAIEIFIHGDGSNNRFRFMVRDGVNQLEGSQWVVIDWQGWHRFTWDYNDAANVFGWVNGDGEMTEGNPFYFDSIQITRNEAGTSEEGLFYFDDLRIVDPFTANFNITNEDGSEVISINNVIYEAGQTEFELFPGEFEFFVQREGFKTYYGTFEIDDEDVAIDVTLTTGDDEEYSVTFTVMDEDGDLVTTGVITINDVSYDVGEYTFSFTPGFYNYNVNAGGYFEVDDAFTVIDNDVFINVVLVQIPDLNDKVLLSWDVASTANQSQFRDEYYSVWAGLAGGEPADFWMIFEETLDPNVPNWEYQHRVVDISNLSQENIQIAFRHHDSTDKDRIVIDNVRIEGINIGDEPDVFLHEDFEGGVPEDFDPADPAEYDDEWLPDGWVAIDADDDGLNWYFAIRVIDDENYVAHMRSQSWNVETGEALTPDNWLFTPNVQMPLVLFFTATFNITDEDGNPLTDAIITLDDIGYDAGHYQFTLTNGTYAYEVHRGGYMPAEGTFDISGASKTIDVTLNAIPTYAVTFNVNMIQHDDFEPGVTDVYMTGSFPAWDWAAPGTFTEQQMDPTENVFIFTRTLELPEGTYEYKYFDGPSWDDGEWPGGENRVIEVTGEMTVNDVFGTLEPLQVIDHDAATLQMFPNPAYNLVTIEHSGIIDEVSVYSLNGQLMLSKKVGSASAGIDIGNLPTGLYIVKVVADNEHFVNKLQVVR